MQVKVCGMTQLDQLLQLNEWGVPYAGMIFYEKSPRYVKNFSLHPLDLKREKWQLKKVGVFVNESLEAILQTVEEWGLDMVQLHGDETPKFCEQVSEHVKTIKAFRLGENEDIEWKVYPYREFVDLFLFDSGGKGVYGGTGQKFNWASLQKTRTGKSFMLSGGVGPEDVREVRSFVIHQPEMIVVDVNSKFEISPGVKNMEKIKTFINALNH